MEIADIIKGVRWCIDEEATNSTSFNSASDDVPLMDNIIKDKIKDALRWVCLYAPADLLGGSDEEETSGGTTAPVDTGIMVDVDLYNQEGQTAKIATITGQTAGRFNVDGNFIKLARVRVDGWHRAVRVPITEDSDEYLQLYDENGATATADRPQAALIEKSVRQIEVWPWTSTQHVNYTYVASVEPKGINGTGAQAETVVAYALPPRVRTSFIYYLAYLLCSAYGDPRAERMLDIAKQNLGK